MIRLRLAVYLASFFLGVFSCQAMANKGSDEHPMSDSAITHTIKANIKKEPALSATVVEIITKDGVVILEGMAQSDTEMSRVVEIAGSTKGVKDVDTSKLKVKESKKPFEDTVITAKVKGAFIREKLFGEEPIAVMSISVETIDGVVHLSGTAQTMAQIENAKKLAEKVKGVKSVDSTIKLEDNHSQANGDSSKHNVDSKSESHKKNKN